MVPVIKKFWYNPFSGIIISSLLFFPINKFNLEISLLDFFILDFFLDFLIKKLLKIKLEKIKLEKIYVKIKVILIYFHSFGFFEHISKGCMP